jgi:dipeptidase D
MKYSDCTLTQGILEIFEAINKIPRKSKHEEAISEWLFNWGKEHGFDSEMDEVRNVLIRVPATSGMEDKDTVTIQGHMDMVCVKTPDSNHDFFNDPIEMYVDGEWLKARNTTLGGDNGIALAIGMFLAIDEKVAHGPLELLFTVDEETGLTGAAALKANWLKGKYLLNIDSEDEGIFTIGCAGGEETRLYLPLEFQEPTEGYVPMMVKASLMQGGHSGITINGQQANAIKVINRIIVALDSAIDIEVNQFHGGIAHNAVPSNANATIFINPQDVEEANKIIAEYQDIIKKEYEATDPHMVFSMEEVECQAKVLTPELTSKVFQVLAVFPHGVKRMSKQIENLVETSNNLAIVKTNEDELEIISSQRSSMMSALKELTDSIHFLGYMAGARVENRDPYNAWEPIWTSSLLEKTKNTYKELTGKDAVIEVIHAGLECGLIGSKYPEMEMISMGPTLRDVHTPDERLLISDIPKIYDFIEALLKAL